MTLETLNAIAQLLAGIGVIASLFYLAAQIRQNTRSMRAVVVDSLAHSLIDLLAPQASDVEFARAFSRVIKDWNAASEEDRMRTVAVLLCTFKLFENAWFQRRQGTLDAQQWEGWDAYARMYFHLPGVKSWWLLRRATFAAGFRDYVENSEPIDNLPPLSERSRQIVIVAFLYWIRALANFWRVRFRRTNQKCTEVGKVSRIQPGHRFVWFDQGNRFDEC